MEARKIFGLDTQLLTQSKLSRTTDLLLSKGSDILFVNFSSTSFIAKKALAETKGTDSSFGHCVVIYLLANKRRVPCACGTFHKVINHRLS